MRISECYILKTPADCSFQIKEKTHYLGSYDDEADAARAFDRVARVLGRPLNFSGNDGVEVAEGPRSEGADQSVANAVEAAKRYMDKRAAEKAKRWQSAQNRNRNCPSTRESIQMDSTNGSRKSR